MMDEMSTTSHFMVKRMHGDWQGCIHLDHTHGMCNGYYSHELHFIVEFYQQEIVPLLEDIKDKAEDIKDEDLKFLNTKPFDTFDKLCRNRLTNEFKVELNPTMDGNVLNKQEQLVQSPLRTLIDHFQKYSAGVLLFMHDYLVPFEKLKAEHDTQILQPKQISGSAPLLLCAQRIYRVRHCISTVRKQDLFILDAHRSVFIGNSLGAKLQSGYSL